jgi:energy-coupling factor transporter ATP-binding protein EcfA2
MKLKLGDTVAYAEKIPEILSRKEFCLGLEAVDDYTGTWGRGEIIVIDGSHGAGKTALAKKCALANKDHRVLVLTEDKFRYKGIETKELPMHFSSLSHFSEFFENLKYDLIIIDGDLSYTSVKQQGFYTGSIYNIFLIMARQKNKAIVMTRTIRGKVFGGGVTTEIIDNKSSLSYLSSKIIKLTKKDDFVKISLIKNRETGAKIEFYYQFLSNNDVDLIPVNYLDFDLEELKDVCKQGN